MEEVNACAPAQEEGVPEGQAQAPQEPVPTRHARVQIFQDEGRLVAEAAVEPPLGEGRHVTVEDVRAALVKEGIVFGVDEEAVNTLAQGLYGKKLVVARGVPAQDGVDGVCTELFARETERSFATREDGTLDYKELGLINEVREGTELCRCTAPTPGAEGTNVRGQRIKARDGKRAIPPAGDNTRMAEDGLRLEAAAAGNLVFRDGRFSVDTVYRVQNVDYEVGNITFSGDVVVNGDMQDGFEIHSGGTVTLRGQVGAVVVAAENIVIEKGINGTGKAVLEAAGQLKAGFVESCNLRVGGKINVSSLINCRVECEGDVDVTSGKGLICGGKITAFGSVKAKVVGNESNTLTTIVLGVTPKLLQERKRLNEQIADVTKHIDEMSKNVAYISRLVADGRPVPPDRVQFLKRTQMLMPMSEKKRAQLQNSVKELEERMQNVQMSALTANQIFPPTRVSIGALSGRVAEKRDKCRVYKSEAGELVFGSA